MDAVIVIVCMVGMVTLWAWTARPDAPNPEAPQEAPASLAENVPALLGVLALFVVAVGAVLAL